MVKKWLVPTYFTDVGHKQETHSWRFRKSFRHVVTEYGRTWLIFASTYHI